jgi:hypothetical protein
MSRSEGRIATPASWRHRGATRTVHPSRSGRRLSNGIAELYVNGVLASNDATLGTTGTISYGTNPQMTIGGTSNAGQNAANARHLVGYTWNRVLSATEALSLHRAPYQLLVFPDDEILMRFNGGAAIALMTFLGNLASKPGGEGGSVLAAASPVIKIFVVGLGGAVLAAALAYVAQVCYIELATPEQRKYVGNLCRYVALVGAVGSIIAFGVGAWMASDALSALRMPHSAAAIDE